MTMEYITQLWMGGLKTVMVVIGPPLVAAMAVGLFIAVMQAATQVQEASLSFVPKLVAIGVTLLITGEWALGTLMTFFTEIMKRFVMLGGAGG